MPEQTCAVILAGGEGKRMKSNHPKVLASVLFKPMLQWVMDAAEGAGVKELCVVTGHKHEQVEAYLQAAQKPGGANPGCVVYYTNYSLIIDSDISSLRQID